MTVTPPFHLDMKRVIMNLKCALNVNNVPSFLKYPLSSSVLLKKKYPFKILAGVLYPFQVSLHELVLPGA